MSEGGTFLGIGMGIVMIGLIFSVETLDTLLIDFSTLETPSVRIIQFGFFAMALYFFSEW